MPRPRVTIASPLPAHRADQQFFIDHPARHFRARPYVEGDGPPLFLVTLFGDDGTGHPAEINLTIIKRIKGGRYRMLFSVLDQSPLVTDSEIRNFLWSRRFNPATMKYVGR